jgi:hypothetical protein
LVSLGSLSASIVHPRETFRFAVSKATANIIIGHNHPSGDTKPSQEDILLTKRLCQAGEILGINVLDHVIIGGEGNYFSFRVISSGFPFFTMILRVDRFTMTISVTMILPVEILFITFLSQ